MSTYYQIFGGKINVVSSDPSNPIEGQVWFNTTSETLKYRSINLLGTWSSGGNLATSRGGVAGSSNGTQTTAAAFGGNIGGSPPPSGVVSTATEEYDGTSWTSGGSLSTARSYLGGAGTQTSALAFGGLGPQGQTGSPGTVRTETEEYNGTSWTSGGPLGTAKYGVGSCGTQTVALSFGGASTNPFINLGPNTISNVTQEYDGTTWTAGGNYPTTILGAAAAGTQTSALGFGGFAPGAQNITNEYNGTSWTAGGNLGTARYYLGGAGTQTSALGFGGFAPGALTATEAYNGTSWSTEGSMTTGRGSTATSGTQTAALAAGGAPQTAVTEEFTGGPSGAITRTVTGT